MCYRFNQGINGSGDVVPLKTLGKSGWRNGLQLELYTTQAAACQINQDKFMINRGFRIVVFNKSNFFPSQEDSGVNRSGYKHSSEACVHESLAADGW
jgi:hypothetical protein